MPQRSSVVLFSVSLHHCIIHLGKWKRSWVPGPVLGPETTVRRSGRLRGGWFQVQKEQACFLSLCLQDLWLLATYRTHLGLHHLGHKMRQFVPACRRPRRWLEEAVHEMPGTWEGSRPFPFSHAQSYCQGIPGTLAPAHPDSTYTFHRPILPGLCPRALTICQIPLH